MSNKKSRQGSKNGPMIALAAGAVALIGLFGFAVYQSVSAPPTKMTKNEKPGGGCVHTSIDAGIPGVENVPCTSNAHVPDTQKVTYETDPPLSGAHYDAWLNPGFYSVAQTPERIVHSLEHGHVVIYYDKDKLSQQELAAVRALTSKFQGQWDGVLAIARTDAKSALVLTAWENALRLSAYDQAKVEKFVDAFRGRGPEQRVR